MVAVPHPGFLARRHRSYYLFVAPALIVIGAVIFLVVGVYGRDRRLQDRI